MMEIFTAVGVTCGIAALLAAVIVVVDYTAGSYGNCEISINGGSKVLKVEGGRPLLSTLNSEGIFIPSGCGGKGSCGLCKLKVDEGAGEYLPTELPWLSGDEKKRNIRLSCQLKVRDNLKVVIPEKYFQVKEYETETVFIRDMTHDIKEIRLKLLNSDGISFRAGQYVQLKVPEYELNNDKNTSRAYSISSPPYEKGFIELEIRLIPNGICTTYMHKYLKEGEILTINGPYGEFYLRDTKRDIVFIAGGSGMAPIKSILSDMKIKGVKRKATYFFGAVSKKDLFHVDTMKEFETSLPDFKFIPGLSAPADDDEWDGETGLITEVLDRRVENTDNLEAYLCGSPGMIEACVKVLTDKGLPEDLIYYDKFS
jgi:Na+-transporting NADH:ubiquinone oxidoreductase subunit F